MSSGRAVTDRERRHIARALRSYEVPREQIAYFVRTFDEGEVIGAVTPTMLIAKVSQVELGINWDGEAVAFSRRVSDLVADLVDRPACHAVQPAPGEFFECDRCGADVWADAEAVTNYCPMCGAEVVDG